MGELDADTDLDVVSFKAQEIQKKEFALHEYLNKQQLEEIYKIFENAPKASFKKSELRAKILSRYNVPISDEVYDILFTKLDFGKNDLISWDEFVTYLILELECKEKESNQSIIENPIVSLPQVIRSGHRSAIIEITFAPSVRLNGTIDYDDGKYLTMSKDGYLNVWSPDLKLLRTFRDKSLYPTVKNTMVTNFVCLPDLNMLVMSSTELELRFYDMTSKRFHQVLVFQSMPFCVKHMFYHFTENIKVESLLICGDLGGNLRVLQFPKEDKGPFKLKLGVETMVLKWDQVAKGKLPLMKAYSIPKVHPDWVKQVAYYKLLGSIVSCSSSPTAMVIGDIHGSKSSYVFYLKRGIDTFCVCEDTPLVATGSMDCILRIWNPFITTKPISLLSGHHASIVKIFMQDQGRRIFSIDKTRVIRVWESMSQTCLQIYTGFTFENEPKLEFSTYYNDQNHLLIMGGLKIATTTCGKLVDELRSDGKTQTGAISVVLYNTLFKSIVTCGTDSNIVIWDLRTNKSKGCIRLAHSCSSMGELIPLPITAATFDPPHYFLLTGSSDGSIKLWDFNSGICLRNMEVGKNQEVTKLIWLKNRILAVGWNRRVVEFADSFAGKVTAGKAWELRHTNDILSADYRPGQALATGTYNGDLIVWRLETGQSYKRYNVTHPTGLLKLEYIKEKMEKKPDVMSASSKSSKTFRGRREKSVNATEEFLKENTVTNSRLTLPVKTLLAEKVNPPVERNLAVHCLIFLRKREMLPDQATLLTATENGMIQAWSHHPSGSFIQAFRAVHMDLDYVTAMVTDDDNEFLFTGTLFGYIKIWLLKNFCLAAAAPEVHICMPLYRLQFPFLINDRLRTRAKAACRNQPKPLLLSSYKGHLNTIMTITYIQECKILLTGSADNTARVWTLSGRYIGCLGQNKPWLNIEWGENPEKKNDSSSFRVPPDLVRTASYTTMKVLKGAPPIVTKENIKVVDLYISEEEKSLGTYGEKLSQPYLGKYHAFPIKTSRKRRVPPVDTTMMKIPMFVLLTMSQWKPVSRVQTPECIDQMKIIESSTRGGSSRSTFSQSRKRASLGTTRENDN